jgi:hypothetical protein
MFQVYYWPMAAILITYDLTAGDDYSKVLEYIDDHEHAKMGRSCYVIDSSKMVNDVLNEVKQRAPKNASILVADLSPTLVTTDNLAKERAWTVDRARRAADSLGSILP